MKVIFKNSKLVFSSTEYLVNIKEETYTGEGYAWDIRYPLKGYHVTPGRKLHVQLTDAVKLSGNARFKLTINIVDSTGQHEQFITYIQDEVNYDNVIIVPSGYDVLNVMVYMSMDDANTSEDKARIRGLKINFI